MLYKSYLIPNKKLKCIQELAPKNYKRFVDPAIDNGSVFVHLAPKKWLINEDTNAIYNMWRTVKDNPVELSRCLRSNHFDEISKPAHAAMFMYLQDYKHIIGNPEPYFANIKKISAFMNETEGVVTDIRADDVLNNCTEKDDFVFLDFKNISRSSVKVCMMDAIQSLDEKSVRWMLIHNNNAYVRTQFNNYNIKFDGYDKDELVIMNY